jgi:colanic acid biosynthesis protein WcaH
METSETAARRLPAEQFLTVISHTPLVSIDLIIEDGAGHILVGMRTNRPACGFWFVPGGRVLKDEGLDAAFTRICQMELGMVRQRQSATFLGVYEHFYPDNFSTVTDITTHYVVLGYRMRMERSVLQLPREQHSAYRWLSLAELLADAQVHDNTKRYFASAD